MHTINRSNAYPIISFKQGWLTTDDKSLQRPDDVKYREKRFITTGTNFDDIDFGEYYPACDKDLLKKAVTYLAKDDDMASIDLSKSRWIPKNYAVTRFGNVNYTVAQGVNGITKNLYHFFKRNTLRGGAFQNTELADQIHVFKAKSKNIGSLPLVFIDRVDKKEIGNVTSEVQLHFGNFASAVRRIIGSNVHSSNTSDYDGAAKELGQKLSEITGKEITVNYKSEGSFGIVFKIECEKQKFALKVHKGKSSYNDDCSDDGHASEVTNAVYMNSILPFDKCSKFYCASFEDNYMLTGFVDGEDTKNLDADAEEYNNIRSKNPWNIANVKNPDILTKGNKIGTRVVDYGEISFRFRNKADARYARLLFPLIEERKKDDVKKFIEKHQNNEEYINFINYFFMMNSIPSKYNGINLYSFIASQAQGGRRHFTKDDIGYLELLGADFSGRDNINLPDEYKAKFFELFS